MTVGMRSIALLGAALAVFIASASIVGAQEEGQKRVRFLVGFEGVLSGHVLCISTRGERGRIGVSDDLESAQMNWPAGATLWVVPEAEVAAFVSGEDVGRDISGELRPNRFVDEASTLDEIRHLYELREGPSLELIGQRFTYDDGFFEDVGPDGSPSRAPSIWATAMPWVSLAVLGNGLLAIGVLFGRRRKQEAA